MIRSDDDLDEQKLYDQIAAEREADPDGLSALEKEFKQLYLANKAEIAEAVAELKAATDKVVALSEKYMIPFSGIGCEDYIPHSLMKSEKYKMLSFEQLEHIMDEYIMAPAEPEYFSGGWMNSSMTC